MLTPGSPMSPWQAAIDGHLPTLQALQGTPDIVDPIGRTPLSLAVSARHLGAIRCLLDQGANPNHAVPREGPAWQRVLRKPPKGHTARCFRTLEMLLGAGACVRTPNILGYSCLAQLVERRKEDQSDPWALRMLDTLLAHPAIEVDAPGRLGSTPLALCVPREHRVAACRLIAAGADPHRPDGSGVTSVRWAQEASPPWDKDLLRLHELACLRLAIPEPGTPAAPKVRL